MAGRNFPRNTPEDPGVAARTDAPLPSADPWRRLMGFVYEAIILFGVIWFAGYVFTSLTHYQVQRGNVAMHHAFQIFTFLVLGVYFSWFWTGSRRTVPMKTLALDLVDTQQGPLSAMAAVRRYLTGLTLFLAAMACGMYLHRALFLLVFLPYAWCFFDPHKRALTDVLAGTRLVVRPVEGKHKRGLI